MPYAQLHYPFENKDKFERNFPADFIAEGLDQVWLLSLPVLRDRLFTLCLRFFQFTQNEKRLSSDMGLGG